LVGNLGGISEARRQPVIARYGGDATLRRDEAVEMLRRVHIPEPERRVDAYPHQLPGGMRQRVMIAMAVSCDPKVLIADEPTTALDVTIQAQILDLMRELQDRLATAIILITYDMGVVAENADRVVVMYARRKVQEASAEALFERPGHPYTKRAARLDPQSRGRGAHRHSPPATERDQGNGPLARRFAEGLHLCAALCRRHRRMPCNLSAAAPAPNRALDSLLACRTVRHEPARRGTRSQKHPDYALSSAIKPWYRTGTYGCFCGFE
jgi:ABC-type dipeptide/oligopeptide/nickel transport system ATPase component